MSIYALKPAFQRLLRPLAGALHGLGVTANQVTVCACLISVILGLTLAFSAPPAWAFALIPLWMFLRMALNAIDGMLAREFAQRSALGGYLNELTDVVSDAALYLPFAFVVAGAGPAVLTVIWLAAVSELAGCLGVQVGASRRYDGPMGKSDRAFVFGALGLWLAVAGTLPHWSAWILWAAAALTAVTIVRRVRGGLRELAHGPGASGQAGS